MSAYIPKCLRNLDQVKSRTAASRRKKAKRDLATLTLLESIERLKSERRSKPKDWERGYNSAITTLELFMLEIEKKEWAVIEGEL